MKIIRRCKQCGNAFLEYDAYVYWNVTDKQFDISSFADEQPYCPDCGERVEEIYIEIPTKIKII